MNLDLSKIKKVFFVGIGGIGISAIARLMFLEGKEVSGSDMSENVLTHELAELGIKITIGQGFEFIPKDADLIVYTIAIPHYDPKLFEQIKNSRILFKSYPEMLGLVTKDEVYDCNFRHSRQNDYYRDDCKNFSGCGTGPFLGCRFFTKRFQIKFNHW